MHTQLAFVAEPETLARLASAGDPFGVRTADGGPIDACLSSLQENLEFYGRMLMAAFQS